MVARIVLYSYVKIYYRLCCVATYNRPGEIQRDVYDERDKNQNENSYSVSVSRRGDKQHVVIELLLFSFLFCLDSFDFSSLRIVTCKREAKIYT